VVPARGLIRGMMSKIQKRRNLLNDTSGSTEMSRSLFPSVVAFCFLLEFSAAVGPTSEFGEGVDKERTSSLPLVACDRIAACAQLFVEGLDLPRFNDSETSCDPDSVCGCDPRQLLEFGGVCWFQSSSQRVREKLLKMQIAVFYEMAPFHIAPPTLAALNCPPIGSSDSDVPLASLFSNPDIYIHPALVLRHRTVSSAINTTMRKRAVFTTSSLEHGDVVMKIPKQALLSKGTLKESPNGQFVLGFSTNLPFLHPLFSVFLLFEKEDPSTTWRDIICHLSDSYSHSAHFWPFSAIKNRGLEQETLQRLSVMFLFYNQMAPAIASRWGKTVPWSFFDLRYFLWAYFSMEFNSVHVAGPESLSIVPALHQLQHSLKPNLKLNLESSSNSFYRVVVSKRKGISVGHELTISHGAFCNDQLMIRYGLTKEGNKLRCN
jgi:hypothetical protein